MYKLLRSLPTLDRVIISLSVITFVVSTLAIVNDRWLYRFSSDDLDQLEPIGEVVQSQNDVRRRYQIRFSWSPLEEDDIVFRGDRIFTGPNSYAVVQTENGGEISISSNSLVVVNTREDSLFLDIDFGSIQGKVEKGKKFLIGSNDKITEFSGAGQDAVVKVDVSHDKNLVVNVLEGQVKVQSDGASQTLGMNQEVNLEHGKQKESESAIVLMGPLANQEVQEAEVTREQLRFEWKSHLPFSRYKVTVATDPEMKSVILEKTTESTTLTVTNLPRDKKIYWQVIGQMDEDWPEVSSPPAQAIITTNSPPRLKFPFLDSTLYYETSVDDLKSGLSLSLAWEPQSPSDLWEVQLAKDPAFAKRTLTYLSRTTSTRTDELIGGTYYWRVRSKSGRDGPWSVVGRFNVLSQSSGTLPVPLVNAENTFFLKTRADNISVKELQQVQPGHAFLFVESAPQLRWGPVTGAHKYLVEVASDEKFSQIKTREIVTATHFIWRQFHLGEFYWRVQAIGLSAKSEFCEPQKFIVQLSPPESLTREVVIEEVPDFALMEVPPPAFTMSWSPTLFAHQYELQFDETKDFKKPLVLVESVISRDIQVQVPGTYYWRVRALDENKKPLTEFSPTFSYTYRRVFKNPAQVNELKALLPNQRETMVFVGVGKSKVFFNWTTPFNKETVYEIEVSREPDFRTILFSYTTPSSHLKYEKPLPEGWIFWRLRAKNKHFTSPWTAANSFHVKYEKTPFDFEESDRRQALRYFERQSQDRGPSAMAPVDFGSDKAKATLSAPSLVKARQVLQPQASPFEKLNYHNLKNLPPSEWLQMAQLNPTLEWSAAPEAESYVVEVSENEFFNPVLLKKKLPIPPFQWSHSTPGLYYWRVRAIKGDQESSWSRTGTLQISSLKPVSLTPSQMTHQSDSEVKIQWTPAPGATGYFFEFSEDISFRSTRAFREKKNEKILKVADAGLYFWRVRAVDKFNRFLDDQPEIHALHLQDPKESKELILVENEWAIVSFTSTKTESAPWLLISSEPDLKNPIVQEQALGSQWTIRHPLPSGRYHWRLGPTSGVFDVFRILNKKIPQELKTRLAKRSPLPTPKIPVSASATFTTPEVSKEKPIERPQFKNLSRSIHLPTLLDDPKNQPSFEKLTTETVLKSITKHPEISWEPVKDADSYILELSANPYFSPIEMRKKTSSTQFTWQNPRPGRFYWRVQATNGNNMSLWSHSQVMDVFFSPPISLTGAVQYGGAKETVFRWSPVPHAALYELEVASDIHFHQKRLYKTKQNFKTIRLTRNNYYFWRVKALDKFNRYLNDSAAIHALDNKLDIREPATTPLPGEVIRIVADEPVRLTFKHAQVNSNGQQFFWQLANKPEMTPLLLQAESDNNTVLLGGDWPEGIYYWRMGQKKGGSVQWSPPQSFEIQRIKEPGRFILDRLPTSNRPSGQ